MSEATRRVERYLGDEVCACRAESADERVRSLQQTLDSTAAGIDAELELLSALAAETRLRLVGLLVAAEGELCVCELQAAVEASESAVSHALATLSEAGLVESRKDGRWKMYRATNRAVTLVTVVDGLVPEAAKDQDE